MFPTLYGIASQVGVDNWWEAGGATGVLAAYQPKGAASLAASYTDLSGNGNDAAVGVAPTWDAVNGWTFNGASHYLIVPNVAPTNSSRTMIFQFTNGTITSNVAPVGFYKTSGGINIFFISLNHPGSGGGVGFWNGSETSAGQSPTLLNGNLAIAGKSTYRDGVFSDTIPAFEPSVGAISIYLGCVNLDGSPVIYTQFDMESFVLYDNALTATQVAAVAAAMAAL